VHDDAGLPVGELLKLNRDLQTSPTVRLLSATSADHCRPVGGICPRPRRWCLGRMRMRVWVDGVHECQIASVGRPEVNDLPAPVAAAAREPDVIAGRLSA
jgi:hypothetical protein